MQNRLPQRQIYINSVKVSGNRHTLHWKNYFTTVAEHVIFVPCLIVVYVSHVATTPPQLQNIDRCASFICVAKFQWHLSSKKQFMDGIIILIHQVPGAHLPSKACAHAITSCVSLPHQHVSIKATASQQQNHSLYFLCFVHF